MAIIITTKSGSTYTIRQETDGSIIIQKGLFCAKVVSVNEPIRVGSRLNFDCRRYSIYGDLETTLSFLKSTPITGIEVKI